MPLQVPCVFADGKLVQIGNEPIPRLLSHFSEGIIIFTLQLQLQPYDGRQAFARVELTVKQSRRPVRVSSLEPLTANFGTSLTLNIGQQMPLLAIDDTSNAPARVRWSSDAIADLGMTESSVFGQGGSIILLTGKRLLGVSLFTVTASSEDAQASVTVKINLPPEGGNCAISPVSGTENTLFTGSCIGVTDDSFPIRYKLRYWNIETGSVTESSTSLNDVRQFLLPAGTLLVTQIACDAFQSCSELKTTSVVVTSSQNVEVARLGYMRDAVSRGDITQLLDTVKLMSPSLNALSDRSGKAKFSRRLLSQTPSKEILSTLFLSISATALDAQMSLEFTNALQNIAIDRAALASMDISATIEALNKLAGLSSGWAAHSMIASYLAAIFEAAPPRFIPSILATMSISTVRSAADVIVGLPLEYKSGLSANWQMGVRSLMGIELVNASILLPWQTSSEVQRGPSVLISHHID
jgi:hypothetical protein